MKVIDCKQNTQEWLDHKLGMPSASDFDCLITPGGKPATGEGKRKYMYKLIAERILNRPLTTLEITEYMERGQLLEPEAAAAYEIINERKTQSVGWVLHDSGLYGCSPDRFVIEGDKIIGLLEIKCPAVHTHFGYLIDGMGTAYMPQIQGQMLVCGMDWVDRFSYSDEAPAVENRIPRNQEYIDQLEAALKIFCEEMAEQEDKLRKSGLFMERTGSMSALDVAYEEKPAIFGEARLGQTMSQLMGVDHPKPTGDEQAPEIYDGVQGVEKTIETNVPGLQGMTIADKSADLIIGAGTVIGGQAHVHGRIEEVPHDAVMPGPLEPASPILVTDQHPEKAEETVKPRFEWYGGPVMELRVADDYGRFVEHFERDLDAASKHDVRTLTMFWTRQTITQFEDGDRQRLELIWKTKKAKLEAKAKK